ncbi:MAG: FkbM family methyltransferase [Actinomycetota bacterium]|nr:FkbM family methyltransferase [Actinomycetota bacterium]
MRESIGKLEKPLNALRFGALPFGVRCRLAAAPLLFRLSRTGAYRVLVSSTRWRSPSPLPKEQRVTLDGIDIYLARDGSLSDVGTLYEIFISGDYDTDYRDAVVVDLGAHKGYFGAYALHRGAAAVLSYEPESTNFGYLERAAASARSDAFEWRVSKTAVGARGGEAELNVSPDSWTHSLLPRPGRMVDSEQIRVVAMADVLDEARSLGGRRLIVKMDVEGAECEIVAKTPTESWRGVDELFLELHGFSPCSFAQVANQLQLAGLESARSGGAERAESEFTHEVLRFRREQSRGGPS